MRAALPADQFQGTRLKAHPIHVMTDRDLAEAKPIVRGPVSSCSEHRPCLQIITKAGGTPPKLDSTPEDSEGPSNHQREEPSSSRD